MKKKVDKQWQDIIDDCSIKGIDRRLGECLQLIEQNKPMPLKALLLLAECKGLSFAMVRNIKDKNKDESAKTIKKKFGEVISALSRE